MINLRKNKLKYIIIFLTIVISIITIYMIFGGQKDKNIFIRENIDIETTEPILSKIVPSRNYTFDKKIVCIDSWNVKEIDKKDFNILFDMEPNSVASDSYDFIISTHKDQVEKYHKKAVYMPTWSFMFPGFDFSITDLLKSPPLYKKTKFCVFVYSNCNNNHMYPGVSVRESFTKELMSYKHVDCPGKCLNNMKSEDLSNRNSNNWVSNLIEFYKPYKFVISFENLHKEGYVSEKILIPLLAGCVPIYLGASDIKDHFNERFISVRDFKTNTDCINWILNVDRNEILYRKYLNLPITNPQKLRKYAPWYFKDENMYNLLYSNAPDLKTISYKSFTNWKTNPTKPIKIINLNRSKDRWEEIVLRCKKNKNILFFERFPAVDGSTVKDKTLLVPHLRVGEIGVILSNLELFSKLVMDNYNDYYMILEDDVIFSDLQNPDFYVKNAPKDWDIIFLGKNKDYCWVPENNEGDFIKLNTNCMPGAFAFIVRKRAAQFFINFLLPIQAPIDNFFQANFSKLNGYFYKHNVVDTNYDVNTTTIHFTDFAKV